MSKIPVKDPCIRILLERREELKKEIIKLQTEYKAIGEIITREYRSKWRPDHNKDESER